MPSELLARVAVVVGAAFMFVAAVGVVRLGNFYARAHAPTKAATLGLACLLGAVALHAWDGATSVKALLALLFITATAPVGAHILTRAAYRGGVKLPPDTTHDAYRDHARRERAPRPRAGTSGSG